MSIGMEYELDYGRVDENLDRTVTLIYDFSPGHSGTYWEPPEPPEIEITDVVFIAYPPTEMDLLIAEAIMQAQEEGGDLYEKLLELLDESIYAQQRDDEEAYAAHYLAEKEYYDSMEYQDYGP